MDLLKNFQQIFSIQEISTPGADKKTIWQKIRVWIILLFGISLFIFLLTRISIREVLNVLSNTKPIYFISAFFLGISATIFKTIRFGFIFPPPPERRINLYGAFSFLRFIYYLLPFNSGELVYLGVLKKFKFTPTIAETAPAWLFLRFSDIIGLTFWFVISINLYHIHGNLYGRMYSLRWIIILVSIMLILLIFTFPFWIPKISFKISNKWITQRVDAIKSGFSRTFGVKALIRTIFFAVIIWMVLIGSQTLSQFAFNSPLSFSEATLVSITIYCISLIPINTPLNIGTDEAAWTGAMVLAGLSLDKAISIAISIRIVSMLVLFTDGLVGFFILSVKRAYNQPAASA